MVRQDPANRAPKHPDRNGTEGAAKGVHRHLGLLSRVPLWTAPGRAQEHHHHLRCGLRDRWLLRFQPGVRSSWWVFLLRHARECRLSIDLHRAFQDFSSLKEFRAKMIKTIKSSKKKKKRKMCNSKNIARNFTSKIFMLPDMNSFHRANIFNIRLYRCHLCVSYANLIVQREVKFVHLSTRLFAPFITIK